MNVVLDEQTVKEYLQEMLEQAHEIIVTPQSHLTLQYPDDAGEEKLYRYLLTGLSLPNGRSASVWEVSSIHAKEEGGRISTITFQCGMNERGVCLRFIDRNYTLCHVPENRSKVYSCFLQGDDEGGFQKLLRQVPNRPEEENHKVLVGVNLQKPSFSTNGENWDYLDRGELSREMQALAKEIYEVLGQKIRKLMPLIQAETRMEEQIFSFQRRVSRFIRRPVNENILDPRLEKFRVFYSKEMANLANRNEPMTPKKLLLGAVGQLLFKSVRRLAHPSV